MWADVILVGVTFIAGMLGGAIGSYYASYQATKEAEEDITPMTTPPTQSNNQHQLLRYFDYSHLPQGFMQEVSKRFLAIATDVDHFLPDGSEKTTALRKLLEGKDAAVRAALDVHNR